MMARAVEVEPLPILQRTDIQLYALTEQVWTEFRSTCRIIFSNGTSLSEGLLTQNLRWGILPFFRLYLILPTGLVFHN